MRNNFFLFSFQKLDKSATLSIPEFIRLPIDHIAKYLRIITNYLEENQSKNWNTDTFKTASLLMVAINKLNKTVQENFKLHGLKKHVLNDYKSIRYSDKVSLEKTNLFNHRIFVMEGGVVLVCIKDDQV